MGIVFTIASIGAGIVSTIASIGVRLGRALPSRRLPLPLRLLLRVCVCVCERECVCKGCEPHVHRLRAFRFTIDSCGVRFGRARAPRRLSLPLRLLLIGIVFNNTKILVLDCSIRL